MCSGCYSCNTLQKTYLFFFFKEKKKICFFKAKSRIAFLQSNFYKITEVILNFAWLGTEVQLPFLGKVVDAVAISG